ncbi:hypothetical protein GMMP15_1550009 [Candidatus Magnetomoraceae bacterium gMMP-15]
MVSVSGQQRVKIEDFSNKFQLIISMNSDDSEWLQWAAAVDMSVIKIIAQTELDLLMQIKEGLYETSVIPINALEILVHPRKLMSLSEHDLKLIASEAGNNYGAAVNLKIKKVLESNQLQSWDDLSNGIDFLKELEVHDRVIFQVMSLSDQIGLFELCRDYETGNFSNTAILKEAAAFAAIKAQTPREFIDYYLFYIALTDKYPDTKNRKEQVDIVMRNLSPLCNGLVKCPSFSYVDSEENLLLQINNWTLNNRIHFLTKSSAMYYIIKYTILKDEVGREAAEIIYNYIALGNDIVKQNKLKSSKIFQDGAISFVYSSSESDMTAEVAIDSFGKVTLGAVKEIN